MNPQSAVQAGYNTLQDIQNSYAEPGYVKRLRAHFLVLQSCFESLRLAAMESEDRAVWHALGNAYTPRTGTECDSAQAIKWFRSTAEAGHAPAVVSLGLRLLNPKPTPQHC